MLVFYYVIQALTTRKYTILICGNKMPTRCNRGFIAVLTVCSTSFGHHYVRHQEFKSIIQWFAACGISCCGFQVAGLVWSWGLCVRFTSSLICGNKMPNRCNRGFYCSSYCLLNTLRAPLCPSSGVQEYYTVVCCQWYFVLQHPANWTHNPPLHTRPATWKPQHEIPQAANHCIILFNSWWWA